MLKDSAWVSKVIEGLAVLWKTWCATPSMVAGVNGTVDGVTGAGEAGAEEALVAAVEVLAAVEVGRVPVGVTA